MSKNSLSNDQLRATLTKARPDFDADDALEQPMPSLCAAVWAHAINFAIAGETDGQKCVIQAREVLFNQGANVIYSNAGLEGAAEYVRFTFSDALRIAFGN